MLKGKTTLTFSALICTPEPQPQTTPRAVRSMEWRGSDLRIEFEDGPVETLSDAAVKTYSCETPLGENIELVQEPISFIERGR